MREYINISHIFGIVLRKTRQQSNLSQEHLAELANVDKSYVSLLEQGKRQPSITILFKLADALNVSPLDFIHTLENDVPKY